MHSEVSVKFIAMVESREVLNAGLQSLSWTWHACGLEVYTAWWMACHAVIPGVSDSSPAINNASTCLAAVCWQWEIYHAQKLLLLLSIVLHGDQWAGRQCHETDLCWHFLLMHQPVRLFVFLVYRFCTEIPLHNRAVYRKKLRLLKSIVYQYRSGDSSYNSVDSSVITVF